MSRILMSLKYERMSLTTVCILKAEFRVLSSCSCVLLATSVIFFFSEGESCSYKSGLTQWKQFGLFLSFYFDHAEMLFS